MGADGRVQTGSISLLAFIAGDYAARLSIGSASPAIHAACVVMVLSGLNVAGIRPGSLTQTALTGGEEGVSDRTQFVTADVFESDFSQACVITLFLLPELDLRLRPQILGLKPGTRVVSNTFPMVS